ncbi:MAG: AbrB/MazE/SpoVT family DNA-binding domain-containing protein [Lautropia sp.]
MAIAQSKLTAQEQVSIPAEVRKRLGVGPGSVLEWDERRSVRLPWRRRLLPAASGSARPTAQSSAMP